MIEPHPPCANACTDRAPNPEWQTGGDQPPHIRTARPATYGLLCQSCADRLWNWLTDIEVMYPHLSLDLTTAPPGLGIAHSKVSGSPALVRLDVAVMLDPNGRAGDGVCSVSGTLADLTGPGLPSVSQQIGWLRDHWDHLLAIPGIAAGWESVRAVRGMVARAVDWPQPVGRCECGRTVYSASEGAPFECDSCERVYRGRDKLLLMGNRAA